jgi:hypothetical protein
MTRKSFAFIANGPGDQAAPALEWLCVYFDEHPKWTAHQFFDELTLSLKGLQVLPDGVLVMADEPLLKQLIGFWSKDSAARKTFIGRGERGESLFVKSCHFGGWSLENGLVYRKSVPNAGGEQPELKAKRIVAEGLKHLVEANNVVQLAPAGHTFRHPSGTVGKVFVQARELASSDAELGFAARSLAQLLPALRKADLEVVFVDSMGIYPIVRAALALGSATTRIESFRSYTDFSRLSRPVEPYAVVISASTTGGMARRCVEEMGFEKDRVATIIDLTRKGRQGLVLIALADHAPNLLTINSERSDTQIELVGEHFSSKSKPPRVVILGILHEPKLLRRFLLTVGREGTLPLNHTPSVAGKVRPLSLNGRVVVEDSEFVAWVREEVRWRLPLTVGHVIAADDNGSIELAGLVADEVLTITGKRPRVVEHGALTADAVKEARGVVVVQAVVGDGGLLREVSRDLREYIDTHCPRHFICGVSCPTSGESWQRLEQFLIRNPTERGYGFSSWLSLPIGTDVSTDTWDLYGEVAARLQTLPGPEDVHKDLVKKSVAMAVDCIRASACSFLCKPNGDPLDHTPGFVFLPEAFTETALPTDSLTFLIMSSVLQAARELKNPAIQLKSTGYESVVLAPENFQRFNDNILQACLLRAALPSELDYAASPDVSLLMKELLAKVFERQEYAYGGAALEFAAALLTGRIKLQSHHTDELLERARMALLNRGEPSRLLGLLYFAGRLE